MKKGIALFSTLMMLVLVIILMTIALKNTTNIKKSSLQDRFLIQENLTVAEIIKLVDNKIIDKLKSLKGLSKVEVQKIIFSKPIIIKDSVNNSRIEIQLTPNDGKLNINFINSVDGERFVKKIFNTIGVKDSETLKDIILANITNSDKYRDDYKLHVKNLDKTPGYIVNKKEFDEMLNIYVQNSDDTESYNIKFDKFFNFYVNVDQTYNRLSNNELDINYIEVELINSVLGLKNSVRKKIKDKSISFYKYSQLELEGDSEKEDSLKNHGFGFETNNIFLHINTTSMNNKIKYILNYNLKTKKISKISMDRWIY